MLFPKKDESALWRIFLCSAPAVSVYGTYIFINWNQTESRIKKHELKTGISQKRFSNRHIYIISRI